MLFEELVLPENETQRKKIKAILSKQIDIERFYFVENEGSSEETKFIASLTQEDGYSVVCLVPTHEVSELGFNTDPRLENYPKYGYEVSFNKQFSRLEVCTPESAMVILAAYSKPQKNTLNNLINS